MDSSVCWTWCKRVDLKPSQKKWSVDHRCKFNGEAYNSQVCHMLQTKRKIGISENGRPTRQIYMGAAPIIYSGVDVFGPILIR